MYANMLPNTSRETTVPSQNPVLQSNVIPDETSSFTSASKKPASEQKDTLSQFSCHWEESDVKCNKVSRDKEELTNHFNSVHGSLQNYSGNGTPQRYAPYEKPAMVRKSSTVDTSIANPLVLPFSLRALYSTQ
ncbi:unnamed protein product [Caenorhabditis sp. 36 PRJEB53466]|nr:unnamed protein product [Caenorhabditis sp. 36 PRJEB53466]